MSLLIYICIIYICIYDTIHTHFWCYISSLRRIGRYTVSFSLADIIFDENQWRVSQDLDSLSGSTYFLLQFFYLFFILYNRYFSHLFHIFLYIFFFFSKLDTYYTYMHSFECSFFVFLFFEKHKVNLCECK